MTDRTRTQIAFREAMPGGPEARWAAEKEGKLKKNGLNPKTAAAVGETRQEVRRFQPEFENTNGN